MLSRFIRRLLAPFRPAWAAWIPVIASVAGALLSRNKGGGGMAAQNQVYVPGGLGGADETWQALLQQMQEQSQAQTGAVDPVLAASYQKMLGIDTGPLVGAGQRAGGEYAGLSDLARTLSQQITAGGAETMGAGRDVYALGRDPMGELEARERQKVVEASRGASSARGIGMSPYSAGLETEAVRGFNLDWQNNLLSRSIEGLNAMIRAGQTGTEMAGRGYEMGRQVPVNTLAAATAPMDAAQQAYGFPAEAATTYAGQRAAAVTGPQAAIQSQIIPYLNQGVGASAGASQALLGQQAMDFRRQQASLAQLYGTLGMLYGAYKNPADQPWSNWNWGTQSSAPYEPDYGTPYGSPGSMYE